MSKTKNDESSNTTQPAPPSPAPPGKSELPSTLPDFPPPESTGSGSSGNTTGG